MDLSKLDSIIHKKVCPKCNLGMVRETATRVYTCDHSKCGTVYDFSCLTDGMLRLLLESKKGTIRRGKKGC